MASAVPLSPCAPISTVWISQPVNSRLRRVSVSRVRRAPRCLRAPLRPVHWFAVDTQAVTLAIGDTLAVNPLNAGELIATFGVIGVLAIIFAETGLLVGFFFPGDSLLFLAGIAASPFANEIFEGAQLSIWPLLIGAPICAIAGAQLGHLLGAKYGRKMFHKPNSRIFKPEYVDKADVLLQQVRPGQGGHPGPLHSHRADLP